MENKWRRNKITDLISDKKKCKRKKGRKTYES